MRKPTRALVAVLLIGAVSVNADVVRTRGGGSGGAASAVTPGTTTVTGCQNRILYGDNSSLINCEAALGYVASTDTLSAVNVTSTGLTAGRVTYAGTGGLLSNEAGFEYSATTDQLLIPDGTSTVPSLSFAADTNTGWYRSGGDIWNEIYGGVRMVVHASTQVGALTNYQYGWYSGSFASFDTGLTRNAAGVIRATDGGTGIRGFLGGGAAVASATALPVPTGRVFHVTGTTVITSITSTNFQSGACITMIFDGVTTLTDGGNLVLAGNYVTTADDTWSGCYDGTSWFETGRSIN